MKERLVAFDIDGTLAESKQLLEPEMAVLLKRLLNQAEVMVTSGAAFSRIKEQLLDPLSATHSELAKLHVMAANGTAYYRYDQDSHTWRPVYRFALPANEQRRLMAVITRTAKRLKLWDRHPRGPIVESRDNTEVVYSGEGQRATLSEKVGWDPRGTKRRKLRKALADELPDYSVRTAGLTSVDVTQKGMTKAAAMGRLKDVLGLKESEMIYIGDAMGPGGNDAVVKQAGYRTLTTSGPAETAKLIKEILAGK